MRKKDEERNRRKEFLLIPNKATFFSSWRLNRGANWTGQLYRELNANSFMFLRHVVPSLLLSSLSYSFSFRRRPSVLVSIPLYFLLFFSTILQASHRLSSPFIAAQKPFFVSMLHAGMQKFSRRREDIEESWMGITTGLGVYINAGCGAGCPDLSFRVWHRMEARLRVFNYTGREVNLPVFLWSRLSLSFPNKLPA